MYVNFVTRKQLSSKEVAWVVDTKVVVVDMVVVEVVAVVVEVVDGVVNTGVDVDSCVDLIALVVVVTITKKN